MSLGFSVYSIMSSANNLDILLSFFFLFLFLLIGLTGTSAPMLNKSGENGHSCLVHDPKASNFLLFSIRLAMGLSYTAIFMLRKILLYQLYREFLS